MLMITMIAGHATPAIGLQLCGRGGDGGQVWSLFLGDGGQYVRKIKCLMFFLDHFILMFFCRWQDGNRVRQYLSEVIPNIRRQLF